MEYCPYHPGVELIMDQCRECKNEELRQLQAEVQIKQGELQIKMQQEALQAQRAAQHQNLMAIQKNADEARRKATLEEERAEIRAGLSEFSEGFRTKWKEINYAKEAGERDDTVYKTDITNIDDAITSSKKDLDTVAERFKRTTEDEFGVLLEKERNSGDASMGTTGSLDDVIKQNPTLHAAYSAVFTSPFGRKIKKSIRSNFKPLRNISSSHALLFSLEDIADLQTHLPRTLPSYIPETLGICAAIWAGLLTLLTIAGLLSNYTALLDYFQGFLWLSFGLFVLLKYVLSKVERDSRNCLFWILLLVGACIGSTVVRSMISGLTHMHISPLGQRALGLFLAWAIAIPLLYLSSFRPKSKMRAIENVRSLANQYVTTVDDMVKASESAKWIREYEDLLNTLTWGIEQGYVKRTESEPAWHAWFSCHNPAHPHLGEALYQLMLGDYRRAQVEQKHYDQEQSAAQEKLTTLNTQKQEREAFFEKGSEERRKVRAQYSYMYGEIRRVGSEIIRGLRVPDRKIISLDCPNCGGPVTSESGQCPYCGVSLTY